MDDIANGQADGDPQRDNEEDNEEEDNEEEDNEDDEEEDDVEDVILRRLRARIDDSIRSFASLCLALRENDPSVDAVDTSHVDPGHHEELYQILLHNTSVTKLEITAQPLLLLSLKEINAMLSFIRTSGRLDEVRLTSNVVDTETLLDTPPYYDPYVVDIGGQSIAAVLANPGITRFELGCALPPYSFAVLLTQTHSLRELKIYADVFLNPATHEIVADAFGANQSLEKLEFYSQLVANVVAPVLLQLCSHPRLRELILAIYDEDQGSLAGAGVALASLLCSNAPLVHVSLALYDLSATDFDTVFAALQQSNQQRCLTKLSLSYADIEEQSIERLLGFVQTTANNGSNVLKELDLRVSSNYDGTATFGHATSGMLIDSSLECLRISGSRNDDATAIVEFLDGLASNALRIRLSSLHFESLNIVEFEALLRFLPRSDHLIHLSIQRVAQGADSTALLRALRSNASLHSFVVEDAEFWTPRCVRFAHAVGTRNANLGAMIGTPCIDEDAMVAEDDGDDTQAHDASFFATLAASAQQAPRSAQNSMLLGLLVNPDFDDGL